MKKTILSLIIAFVVISLPVSAESGQFEIRGVLPWHNFLCGPSTWDVSDYEKYLDECAADGINFIGFHNYTGGSERYMSYVEPMVRISYGGVVPDAYFDNSQSCRWGSLPIGKDEFAFGTEKYVKFTRGMFGSRGTVTASGKEAHYENAHKLMRQVLELAHARGIRMAMGFEFGIIPPEYFSVNPSEDSFYWRGEAGLIPNPCKPMSAGIHRAAVEDIIESYPGIDYVWLWLSEHSFMGVNPDHALGDPAFRKLYDENVHYFSEDMSVSEKILGVWSLEYIRQTMDILSELGSEARIIIGGWGGGNQLPSILEGLNRALPENVMFSCLNPDLGMSHHSGYLAGIAKTRDVIAIPWFEGDHQLWHYQPRAAMMQEQIRRAAEDGIQGIAGIHWRTWETKYNFRTFAECSDNPGNTRTVQDFYREFFTEDFGSDAANVLAPVFADIDASGKLGNVSSPEFFAYTPSWGRLDENGISARKDLVDVITEAMKTAGNVSYASALEKFRSVFEFELFLDQVGRSLEPGWRLRDEYLVSRKYAGHDVYEKAFAELKKAPVEDLFKALVKRVDNKGDMGLLVSVNQRLWLNYRFVEEFLSEACRKTSEEYLSSTFSYTPVPGGFRLKTESYDKTLTFYADNIVRVAANDRDMRDNELVIVAEPEEREWQVSEDDLQFRIATESLNVTVDKISGNVSFSDISGRKYINEIPCQSEQAGYDINCSFAISGDEGLYGLGQFQDGYMNYREKEILISQANSISVVPFMVSSNGYGILWNNYSRTLFSEKDNVVTFHSDRGKGSDYCFVAGESFDGVISGYRTLTGKAPLYAKSAYGYWQSKERYTSFSELQDVVYQYRKRGLPLDNIVQDWSYWGDNRHWSSMKFDPEHYPDPEENIARLHDGNVSLMCSVWPAVGLETDLYKELEAAGALYGPSHWTGGKIVDFYNPEARDIYFKYLYDGMLDKGVDAVWFDGTEVEVTNTGSREITEKNLLEIGSCHLGPMADYLNTYSLVTVGGVYDNYRKTGKDKRLFILTRSAFSGQQRYGATTWSGDIGASWEIFRNQISAGLNFCMAGIPYWTHDIGAFFPSGNGGKYPEGINDPAYRELYARWFQFGAFTPIFRSHGTGTPREVYRFEADTVMYNSLRQSLRLRYRLIPYIYSAAWKVYDEDYTIMRALPMDFADPAAASVDNEYMFGQSLLVQPVTEPMYYPDRTAADAVPSSCLRTPDGREGLVAEYFNDRNLGRKVFETVHANIDFNWGGISPEKLSQNDFSMRWTGRLVAPRDGDYELGLTSDDGVRMWIDGKLVVDSWEERAAKYIPVRMNLSEGEEKDIRIEYFQAGGGSEICLSWLTPDDLAETGDDEDRFVQSVYLPDGCGWYDFWTGKKHEGGTTVAGKYPADIFPLFVKEGSVLPLGPEVEYVSENTGEPLEIRIYPGADGKFVLYEDAGDGYGYEKGEFSTVEFSWDDAGRVLKISDRKGSFEGMKADMDIEISVMDGLSGHGIDRADCRERIRYSGESLSVKL